MSTKKFIFMTIVLMIVSFQIPLLIKSYKNSQIPVIEKDFEYYLKKNNVDLIIFTRSTCPICKLVKKELDKNEIKYLEIDTLENKDSSYMTLYAMFNVDKVPVIFTKNYAQVGFSEKLLDDLKGQKL